MSTDPEVKRLKAVYHDYLSQPLHQRKWSKANSGNQAIVRERNRLWQRLMSIQGYLPLSTLRILDVGCGSGQNLATLTEWGAVFENLCGIDLLPDRVAAAKKNLPEIHFQESNASFLRSKDDHE